MEVRCQKDGGPDWHKVAPIQNLSIASSEMNVTSGPEEGDGLLAPTSSAAALTEMRMFELY